MGLQAGHRPLEEDELAEAYHSYGPSHFAGRLLATIEQRDKDWRLLLGEIAKLDPNEDDDDIDSDDPGWCESYDPWEALRRMKANADVEV